MSHAVDYLICCGSKVYSDERAVFSGIALGMYDSAAVNCYTLRRLYNMSKNRMISSVLMTKVLMCPRFSDLILKNRNRYDRCNWKDPLLNTPIMKTKLRRTLIYGKMKLVTSW